MASEQRGHSAQRGGSERRGRSAQWGGSSQSGRLAQSGRMTRAVRLHIKEMLDEAEAACRCCAPMTRKEKEHMGKALQLGEVVSPCRGLYVRPMYWNTLGTTERTRHLMKGLSLLHDSWVFAGPTAAVAHGLEVPNSCQETICVATSRKTHLSPDKGFSSIIVSNDEPVTVGGVRATSFERTVYDSVRIAGFRAGLAIADSALRLYDLSATDLTARLSKTCGHRSGIARVRAVVALADGRSENGGESIARATMLELGFCVPDLQREYPNPDSEGASYRVDFAWDVAAGSLLGELDGNGKYLDPSVNGGVAVEEVIAREHRRQSHLLANDEVASMVRFSFADVLEPLRFALLLERAGVPRTHDMDQLVLAAGGTLR